MERSIEERIFTKPMRTLLFLNDKFGENEKMDVEISEISRSILGSYNNAIFMLETLRQYGYIELLKISNDRYTVTLLKEGKNVAEILTETKNKINR